MNDPHVWAWQDIVIWASGVLCCAVWYEFGRGIKQWLKERLEKSE